MIYGCSATYDYYTMYVVSCGEPMVNPNDQKFAYDANTKSIKASAYNDLYCAFAQGDSNPVALTTCNSSDAAQQFTYNNQTRQFQSTMNTCLDVCTSLSCNIFHVVTHVHQIMY